MWWSCKTPPRGGPCLPEPGDCLQISWRRLRQTLPKWRRLGSCNGRRVPGSPRSTWSLSRMVPGGPVEIFITWTTSRRAISIRCPTSKIFRVSCRAHGSFPKSTWSGVWVTRFRWPGPDIHKTVVITPFGLYEFLLDPIQVKECGTGLPASDGLSLPGPQLRVRVPGRYPPGKLHGRGATWPLCLTGSRHTGWCWIWPRVYFAQPELKFLGHRVASDGIGPAEDNIKAIRDFPQPVTVKQLMEFNGMVNFYHRFVPNVAKLMSPLYDATLGMGSGKSALAKAVEWMPEHDAAFQRTKEALVRATCLCHFVPGALLAL